MKKLIILFSFTVFSMTVVNAQLSLSFQSGNYYNKTTVGYKINKAVPYFGLQLFRTSLSSEWESFDGTKHSDESSINIFMPNIGVKLFFFENDAIKGGANLGLYKPFMTGTSKIDGVEDEDFQKELKNVKLFGGELGIFAEYFIAEKFSIGGEFGFRYININSESDLSFLSKLKLNLNATYTTFAINYYF